MRCFRAIRDLVYGSLAVFCLIALLLVLYKRDKPPQPSALEMGMMISAQVQQETLSKEEGTEKLDAALPDYSDPNGLAASAERFVNETLGLKDFIIERDTTGRSGSPVFFIQDKESRKLLSVVKTYENPRNTFMEVYSLDYLQNAPLDNFFCPTIHALGKCTVDESRRFLLSESPAPGKSLSQYCDDLAAVPLDSEERASSLQLLLKAAYETGKSLASLHQCRLGEPTSLPEQVKESIQRDLAKTLEKAQEHPEYAIDGEKLQSYIDSTLQDLESEPHPAGLTYGDVKLAHVFYEPETNKITWIDPPTLSYGINAEGKPNGFSTRDIYGFRSDLDQRLMRYVLDEEQNVSLKERLTQAEIERIREAFDTGYVEGGGTLPTQKQLSVGALYYELKLLSFFIEDPNTAPRPEPGRTALNNRIARIFETLRERIQPKNELCNL